MPERNYQEISRGWAAWLAEHLGELRQADLVKRSGGVLKPALVSRWMRGDHAPSPENAVLVARILGVSPVEVLRAAGHDAMADLVAANPAVPDEKDPVVRRIEADDVLTAEEKSQLVAAYWRRSEDVREDFLRQLDLVSGVVRRVTSR